MVGRARSWQLVESTSCPLVGGAGVNRIPRLVPALWWDSWVLGLAPSHWWAEAVLESLVVGPWRSWSWGQPTGS